MNLDKISTEKLKEELERRDVKTKKKKLSMYGVPMEDTCHIGKECGKIGLSCRNPNCPHT
jgi:hypothetical protein